MNKWKENVPIVVITLIILGFLMYGFWPVAIKVDVAKVTRGSFQITVNEDGKTRIREKYMVTAPVAGKLFRVVLDEGDAVKQGETVLATIEPGDPSLLDARALSEAEARVRIAESSLKQQEAMLDKNRSAYEMAVTDFSRIQKIIEKNKDAITRSEYDNVQHKQEMAKSDLNSTEFAVDVARYELDLAKAALVRSSPASENNPWPGTLFIKSPVNGKVLRVLQKDAGVVTPGTSILEIGDPQDLEMVIDVLSTDAVSIKQSAEVLIEHWGGDNLLKGKVRLVEPSAFLKISALGVEEQRVNVIADFSSPFTERETLGDGFRIEARIVTADINNALKVPNGVLFREAGEWHVFKIVDNKAQLVSVTPGKSNSLETEILKGLSENDILILHPTDKIHQDVKVRWE